MSEETTFEEGDSVVVDFNDVEDSGFEALPRGVYPVVIQECEFSFSQAKGTPMWTLRLEVEDGDYAGRVLFTHMVMAGKGLPITKKYLSRLAPQLLEAPFDAQDEDVIESMIGLRCRAKVVVRKYDGEDRNNVRDLIPADEDEF